MKIRDGFLKWMISTKFQIALLSIGLIYIDQSLYGLKPEVAVASIEKITLGYFTARLVEPIVEYMTAWITSRKGKRHEDQV